MPTRAAGVSNYWLRQLPQGIDAPESFVPAGYADPRNRLRLPARQPRETDRHPDARHCDGASNGPFIAQNLRAQAATAYRTGRWKALPPDTNACPRGDGRLGQQDQFVPGRPVSVRLCQEGKPPHTVGANQSDLARLTAELNQLPATPFGYGSRCGPAGQPAQGYLLTVGYRVGPPVQVDIQEGCHPEVDNGSLQANEAGGVLTLVRQLLGR